MSVSLITTFYESFQRGDAAAMGACYHDEATFKDEAFDLKNGAEVRAMWAMLVSSGKDLKVSFRDVKAVGDQVTAHWDAHYTFSRTGRRVHNRISARFSFKDGLIVKHHDVFDFWAWSRQALGLSGLLLGWTPFLQNKVRSTAMGGLRKYMDKK